MIIKNKISLKEIQELFFYMYTPKLQWSFRAKFKTCSIQETIHKAGWSWTPKRGDFLQVCVVLCSKSKSFQSLDTDDNVVLMFQKTKDIPICENCTEIRLNKVLQSPHDFAGAAGSSDICPLK